MSELKRFDAADYLTNDHEIAVYLDVAAQEAAETNDMGILSDAIGTAAKARDMMQAAKDAGLP